MNKSTLKKLIESLTDEVIAEKKLEEGRPFKVNPKYTHFFVLKSNNKIVNGFEYEKDTDRESIARYAKEDLKDMDLKPSDVSVLTVKGCKQKGIDPFNWDSWNKNIDEADVKEIPNSDFNRLKSDMNKWQRDPYGKTDADLRKFDPIVFKKDYPKWKSIPDDSLKKMFANRHNDTRYPGIFEKTVISSTDGTEKTLTSDQKKKVQMAADGGDTVSIKKKGAPIAEADDAEYEYIIVDSKSDNKKVGGPYKTSRIAHGIADKKDSEYGAVRYIVQSVKKASVKESDTELNENDLNPGQPTEINVAEAIDSAISSLSQTSESTENATYKRLAEKTLRILNTAKEAYSKLAEKMSLDEEKDSDKHVDHVRKHLTKKIKDKKDIDPIMKKYAPVIKKIKGQVADPAKAAEHVWKHILKESFGEITLEQYTQDIIDLLSEMGADPQKAKVIVTGAPKLIKQNFDKKKSTMSVAESLLSKIV